MVVFIAQTVSIKRLRKLKKTPTEHDEEGYSKDVGYPSKDFSLLSERTQRLVYSITNGRTARIIL